MLDVEIDPRYPPNHGNGTSKKSRRERNVRRNKFQAQNGKCYWCGEPMEMRSVRTSERTGLLKDNPRYATFEHLIPKSTLKQYPRFRDSAENIVLAHGSCNNKREKLKWPHDPIYGHQEEEQLNVAR
jgi:hypothetical protein